MGRFLTLFACALLIGIPAVAQDFQNAAAAYKRGDFVAAQTEWRALADGGDAHSQFMLGAMYAAGRGVPRDYVEAAEWYRKAARQGLAEAQNNLGFLYDRGFGVPQDDNLAVNWYLRAAQQGHAQAQNNLGVMYGTGRGVAHDQAEALKWFRLAADQGNQQARHNLDFMKSNKVEAVVKAEPPDEDLAEPSHVVTITEESEPETGEDSQTAQSQAVDAASMPGGEATAALDRPKEPELETIVAKKTPSMLLLAPKADEVVAKEDQADEPAETAEVSRQIDALKKLKTPKEEAKTAPDEAEVVKAAVPPAAEDDGPKTVKAPEPAPVEKSVSAKADPGQMSDSAGAEDASLPTKKASAQTGRYLVQLGALKTGEEAKAKATAARLTQSHKAALGELQVSANRADLGERGVFYRLRAGPLADLKAARALCEKLGARKQACIVVQP